MSDPLIMDPLTPRELAEQHLKALDGERDMSWFNHVLSSEAGRSVLWSILERCGIYSMSFRGDVNDALVNEGRRSVGLWLLNQLFTADPAAYTLLRTEAVQRAQARELELAARSRRMQEEEING